MRRALMSTAILATLALVATLLAGVTAVPAIAGAGYQKPKVDQCRNLSGAQARAKTNSTKPVSCASTHTAQTVGVGKLSAKLAKSSKQRIKEAEASKCQKLFNKYVGRSAATRAKSAFALRIFNPSKAQKKKGARWFRCDAVLPRGSSLSAIKTTKKPLLSSPTPTSQALCQTSGGSPTTCDVTHSYKATSAFKLKGKKYPGKKQVKKDAKNGCNSRISGSFRYDAPSAADWDVKERYVVCFDGHTLPPKETVKPATTLVVPTGTVDAGDPVALTGVATDNAAVGSLSATIRNGADLYLQDNGTLAATANTYPYETTAGSLGTTSVTWAIDLTAGLPEDTYTVAVTVKDVNANSTTVTDTFTVVGQDTTSPTVTISSPSSSIQVNTPFTVNATATDSGLIGTLKLRIKKGSLFLQDNLTFGAGTNDLEAATISALPAANATVSFNAGTAAFPVGADYQVIVAATDASTNANLKTATKNVTVTSAPVSQTVVYQMNEAAGALTMVDSGGSGLNASIASNTAISRGVVFNGATGYEWAFASPTAPPVKPERVIVVPDNPLLDAGPPSDTFEIEMRYRTSNSFGNIIQKGQSGGAQWKIQAPGGKPSCLFKSSTGTTEQASIQSNVDLSDNQWHTYAASRTPTS